MASKCKITTAMTKDKSTYTLHVRNVKNYLQQKPVACMTIYRHEHKYRRQFSIL